jgi:hypothetical protein
MKLAYGRLLNATGRVVGQAKRFSKEITIARESGVCA